MCSRKVQRFAGEGRSFCPFSAALITANCCGRTSNKVVLFPLLLPLCCYYCCFCWEHSCFHTKTFIHVVIHSHRHLSVPCFTDNSVCLVTSLPTHPHSLISSCVQTVLRVPCISHSCPITVSSMSKLSHTSSSIPTVRSHDKNWLTS